MGLELKEPVLVIGLGGAGSKLATKVKESMCSDCLLISNDGGDLDGEASIRISTDPIVNPSSQAIRGFALESAGMIRERISGYSTIVMVANLAGKAGSAIAPVISSICREDDKCLVSFVVMPFRYESNRIFASGVSLRRVKADSACTIIIDNDAMLESNPDLTASECYDIADSAVVCMAESLKSSQIPDQTSILTAGRNGNTESSFRDSLKMLYENTPPNSVRSSIIHVLGGNNIPVGMMRALSSLTHGVMGSSASVEASLVESKSASVVMLSTVQGQTKFDGYDPLGCIPTEDTLDWDWPDSSYNCKLDMYQIE